MTEEDEEFERIEREAAIRRNAIPNQGVNMIVNKEAAMENLVRVCEESLGLIRQLIESQEMAYTAGYEDGLQARQEIKEMINKEVE
jgi:hypothetical protein